MAFLIYDCGCKFRITEPGYTSDVRAEDCHGKLPKIYLSINPEEPESIQNVDLACSGVWDMIGRGDVKGIFQIEKDLGKTWSLKTQPRSIEDLSALISLIRPGCLKAYSGDPPKSMTQRYADRKMGIEEVTYLHHSIAECLKSTYSVLTYQEQSMKIAEIIAGFNKQEADVLRKCVTDDTMFISKKRGYISIKTLLKTGYKNELFLVMDEKGKQQWKKIEKIWGTGKHDVLDIVSSAGMSVKATKYHQFLTNNGWKARMRLNKEDYLVCAKEVEYDGIDLIDENLAIIIAGIISEGYFVEKETATFVNYNTEIMDIFKTSFRAIFNREKSNAEKTVFTIHKEEKDLLCKYMKYGKSGTKDIPEIMMGLTKETTRKFLSFMLACEGGISKAGQFEFSSKSEKIVNKVQLLLLRFGIRSLKLKKYDKKYSEFYYRLYINDVIEQKTLLKELTILWNKEKIEYLKNIIDKKNTDGFSSDLIPQNIVKSVIDAYPYIGNGESGSIYKKPVSRERFKRLCNRTLDKNIIDLPNGRQQYCKIKSGKKTKEVETYDFTIAGGDTPYIIANGIVIHNSIGKKKADLMAKVEKEFLTKAEALGVVTLADAKEIFGWIRESQKYSFNKCLGGHTVVLTNKGTKFIQDIQVGDWVMSPTGFVEVLNVFNNGRRRVNTYYFSDGRHIECTKHHKFAVKENLHSIEKIEKNNLQIDTYFGGSTTIVRKDNNHYVTTYDLEVDSKEHVFYANGLLCSNSHGITYATDGFWSAFIKHHFPIAFYGAWIKGAMWKADTDEEVTELINDCKLHDIDVRIPELHSITPATTIINDEFIQFGAGEIKGVGDSFTLKMEEKLNFIRESTGKNLKDLTWLDFLIFGYKKLGKTTSEAFINIGVLDYLTPKISRTKMNYEVGILNKLSSTGSELEWLQANYKLNAWNSLADAFRSLKPVKKEGGGCSTAKRSEIIGSLITLLENPTSKMEDSIEWICNQEEHYLGTPITASKVDSCVDASVATMTCKDFLTSKGKRNEFISLAVEIVEVEHIVTKKGKTPGAKMAKVKIRDSSMGLNAVIFPKAFSQYGRLVQNGNTVLIIGERTKENNLSITQVKEIS